MNTRKIQPIEIWANDGQKQATILALSNFFDYHFDNGSGKVTYKLIGMEGETPSAVEYFIADLQIPSEVIQQWGTSDDIIWSYVAQKLNIVIID